jgi:hypothetical protein
MKADEVARLIPKKLPDTLLAALVQRGRLAPLDDKTPPVQYSYGGIAHPRRNHGRTKNLETRFFFNDEGSSVAIDE